jgi:DNA-binding transcriptional LysR family regulator
MTAIESRNAAMDLRQMEMFRAVAEEGSFTKAAERLHVSQSAVSRQVKLLEDELGGVLLHRGPRKVALTGPGELLLKTTHRVERELQDALAQIAETRALQRGTLSLAGGMTVCMYILPRVLKRFRSLYPKVELSLSSAPTAALLERLRRRELDLALLTLPVVAADVEVKPVIKEEMVVVTAPGHPLMRERPVAPKSLGRYPLIVYEAGSNTRRILDDFFVAEEVPVRIAMETENVEVIKAMVGNGLGVSVIPFAAAAKDVRQKRLAYARLRGRRLYRETGWVYLKSDAVPRAALELMRVFDLMKGNFGGGPPRG